MRNFRKLALLTTTVVACFGGALTVPVAAQAAAAPTVTVLPFGNPADVVSTGDRVFVSGGRSSTQIVVTNATGAITGTIDGLPGPTDLQLSNDRKTLYVALPTANEVAAYDTGTLIASARYSTGDGACPSSLAFTGRFVWFGYGCDQWGGNIGRIDLGHQPAVVTTGVTNADFYDAPLLASAVRNTKVLLVGQPSLSPASDWTYSIGAGGALTQLSEGNFGDTGENQADIALDPTGTTAYLASGWPYHVQSFQAADLTKEGPSYETGAYPTAVEVSRDGTRIAGGAFAWYDPDVFVYGTDGTAVAQFELGGQDHVLARNGLAWAPNGRRLYAISNDGYFYETPAQLHVLPIPAA
jgi:hypothetical protein